MSIDALSWAFKQDIKPSSLKFILVALADNCGYDDCAWPSIRALTAKTGQNRKTVIDNLDKLEEMGIIEDSGRRVGATGQVKVYRLTGSNGTENGTVVNEDLDKGTENGTVPKTELLEGERVPETEPLNSTVFTPNSTVFTRKSTVFTRKSTENGTRNHKEPIEPKEPTPTPETLPDAPSNVPTKSAAVSVVLRSEGWASVSSMHPDLIALVADGAEIQLFIDASRETKARGKNLGYLFAIVKRMHGELKAMVATAATASAAPKGRWFDSDAGIAAKAAELGLEQIEDETLKHFMGRINEAITAKKQSIHA